MSDLLNSNGLSFKKFQELRGPIIDIRSPKEYVQGHWPGAKNLPLFSNKERELIGTIYKKKGSDQATLIGLKLIIPKISILYNKLKTIFKDSRKEATPIEKYYLRIYCWRGGMRSKSLVWLTNLLGLNSVQLKGGYKSYRKWVLSQFEKEWPIKLIGGKTGVGKTDILLSLKKQDLSILDLEGLANHRGSSFGAVGLNPQPTSEHYENTIAESLKNCSKNPDKNIWIEDESGNLGKCRVPKGLLHRMKNSPVIELKRTKKERIQRLVKVYSKASQKELEEATSRISKRLGPQRTKKALEAISSEKWDIACSEILDYYDKCYEYQLRKRPSRSTVDISGMNSFLAAKKIIELYLHH